MSAAQPHHNPLSHVSLGVASLPRAQAFYTPVLAPLGLRLVYTSPPAGAGPPTLGYGPDEEHEVVNVFEYPPPATSPRGGAAAATTAGTVGDAPSRKGAAFAHPPGRGSHLAFAAPSRAAVRAFHAAAVANGGECNGPPGLRRDYGSTYYAAFVVDPEGWRIEAVCKKEGKDDGGDEGGAGRVGELEAEGGSELA